MKELEKLKQAAVELQFEETSRIPPVSPVIGGQTYQLCAVDDPFQKKLFINDPVKLQCMAMRAMLYFWKVLRVKEAVVFDDPDGNPAVMLDFGEGVRIQIDLPPEMGMAPVSPVRMIANLVFGKLHDEAIATRGVMTSDELPTGFAEELVEDAQVAEEESTGVHSAEELAAQAQASAAPPVAAPPKPASRPPVAAPPKPAVSPQVANPPQERPSVIIGGAPSSGNEEVTRVNEPPADELPLGIGDDLVVEAQAEEGIAIGDDDIEAVEEIEEIEDISDSIIIED